MCCVVCCVVVVISSRHSGSRSGSGWGKDLVASQEFIGGIAVSDAGIARWVMFKDGFAMAWRLSNTDRSGDDGVVKLCWKVGGNLFNHLA